ncbi:glycosyltransferase family 39 protein [Candidatus Hepatobacter penaei]|uniref:glycosyltransferase family 39 protein n=1 Tax=Candidatus Hepatobacter penaei TaxID=1274402 RepID=UPI0004F3ECC7|nr:glycosyltransferase family 39 protein [Candidatus Hepatobacter penaei]
MLFKRVFDGLRRQPSFWLFLALLSLFLLLLGHRPFSTPDEGRYVEIPREMIDSGEWVVPHLNGLPYFEKPPLVYWVEACSMMCLGDSSFAMRLPLALMAWLGCLIVYFFMKRVGGRQCALWGAVCLGTNILYVVLARFLILDLFLTVFITGALFSFFLATMRPSKTIWLLSYGACMAAAVMTKGLVGCVLPGLIILVWIAWQRQPQMLIHAFHPYALGMFFLLATPWHVWVAMKNSHFLWFYFIHEHVLRYTTEVHSRVQPFFFFVPIVLFGFFPWIAWVRSLTTRSVEATCPQALFSFLWVWVMVVFVFFSCGQSKLVPYVLPLFPPLAVLTGYEIHHFLQSPQSRSFPWVRSIYGLFSLILCVGLWVGRWANWIQVTSGLDANTVLSWGVGVLGLLLLVQTLMTFWVPLTRRVFVGMVLVCQLVLCLFLIVLDPLVQRYRSIEDVAITLNQRNPKARVVVYRFYPQDLPVYLKRTVGMLDYQGELSFGHQISPGNTVVINTPEIQSLWQHRPCFIVALERDFELFQQTYSGILKPARVVYRTAPYVVWSNDMSVNP